MWPFGSMYTRPSPCIRKACSTRSTYSAGVSNPTMSVQLRISVFRFRQLSAIRADSTSRSAQQFPHERRRTGKRDPPPPGSSLSSLGPGVLRASACLLERHPIEHEPAVRDPSAFDGDAFRPRRALHESSLGVVHHQCLLVVAEGCDHLRSLENLDERRHELPISAGALEPSDWRVTDDP